MLRTRFTELLGLGFPVMSAPMSNHSGGHLAAAVSATGGLGTFGGTNELGPGWLRQQLALIRSRTDRPFGVGFITQRIGADPTNFEVVLEERVPVVVFSFADPQPWLSRAKDAGAFTICQVQSAELAELAVLAGADALLAQGNEAGGHTGQMNLLPLLVGLVERYPEVPVLAAGGITSGRALAAVLAAGRPGGVPGYGLACHAGCGGGAGGIQRADNLVRWTGHGLYTALRPARRFALARRYSRPRVPQSPRA